MKSWPASEGDRPIFVERKLGQSPRLVVAGTASGVGKTSLVLGIVRALVRQGLRVQPFKVGPDFLDPTYLARASGRTCYNLDAWMSSHDYVRRLFARAAADADLAVIEGVMGLFDGASPNALEGSTAEIAALLRAPILLVLNAHGAARSLAATVKGFAEFEPGVSLAGVIANQSGSSRHVAWLNEALASAGLPPLLGAMPRGSLPSLESRHLGLTTADESVLDEATLDALADACQEHLDMPRLLEIARAEAIDNCQGACAEGLPLPLGEGRGEGSPGKGQPPEIGTRSSFPSPQPSPKGRGGPATRRRVRLGIARDEAFHFYYPDNLESLAAAGAQWAEFSPLADCRLPEDLDGLYFGGGYPEVHAARLAANHPMLDDVRRFAASRRAVYAECGGLMYLGRAIRTLDGVRQIMAGVLPLETAMLPRLKSLGYAEVSLAGDSLWGAAGDGCRGHEFHYSQIVADDALAEGWRPAYSLRRRRAAGRRRGRLCKGPAAGQLRPLALGLASHNHRTLFSLLRRNLMNDAPLCRRPPHHQPRQPAAEVNRRFMAMVERIAACGWAWSASCRRSFRSRGRTFPIASPNWPPPACGGSC